MAREDTRTKEDLLAHLEFVKSLARARGAELDEIYKIAGRRSLWGSDDAYKRATRDLHEKELNSA